MPRILHFGTIKFINPGVKQQLDCELIAAEKASIKHNIVYFSHNVPDRNYMKKPASPSIWLWPLLSKKLINYINLRASAYLWLIKHQDEFDIVLIRYPLGDFIFPVFCFWMKPFFTIHHTKELQEIKSKSGLIFKIQLLLEKLQFLIVKRKALGFIGVTDEIAKYQRSRAKLPKSTTAYPNGILKILPKIEDNRTGKLKLCCICSKEAGWHGLTRIYREIEQSEREDFEIYFVGRFIPPPEILLHDPRVKFTGQLDQKELASILSNIDLCIGPFGLDLINLSEACPLKTRESLQHGIPVMANYSDPCFNSDFPFFLRSEFTIDAAIAFAKRFRHFTKEEIARLSYSYISKEAIYRDLIDYLKVNTGSI